MILAAATDDIDSELKIATIDGELPSGCVVG